MTTSSQPTQVERRAGELATITDAFPAWKVWGGALAGLLYAKRSAPQVVVRSTTAKGLRQEIEQAERERALR